MRVALINNGTKEPEALLTFLAGHSITEYALEHAREALSGPHDLVVLSGSSRFPIAYNLDAVASELELVRETSTPLLGICFGAELLAVAYGGTLKDLGHKEKGIYSIAPTSVDPALFEGRTTFEVYEAHRWSIGALPEELEALATSSSGAEIIRHRTKPQYGFQFHPEKMCDETYGDELFRSFIARIVHHSDL